MVQMSNFSAITVSCHEEESKLGHGLKTDFAAVKVT